MGRDFHQEKIRQEQKTLRGTLTATQVHAPNRAGQVSTRQIIGNIPSGGGGGGGGGGPIPMIPDTITQQADGGYKISVGGVAQGTPTGTWGDGFWYHAATVDFSKGGHIRLRGNFKIADSGHQPQFVGIYLGKVGVGSIMMLKQNSSGTYWNYMYRDATTGYNNITPAYGGVGGASQAVSLFYGNTYAYTLRYSLMADIIVWGDNGGTLNWAIYTDMQVVAADGTWPNNHIGQGGIGGSDLGASGIALNLSDCRLGFTCANDTGDVTIYSSSYELIPV